MSTSNGNVGNENIGGRWIALYPSISLVIFFLVPFSIMLAVSFFKRVEGGFFEPSFVLSNYVRFFTPFFGKVLLTSISLSAAAALIAVIIAFPFTFFLSRMPRREQTMILVF